MFQVLLTEDNRVLVYRRVEDALDSLPLDLQTVPDDKKIEEGTFFFTLFGSDCLVRHIGAEDERPRGCYAVRLRDSRARLPHSQFRMAVKGAELLNNDRENRFCGRCGSAMRRSENGLSKICLKCGNEIFPSVAPCVIVLIKKGEEVLLVRAKSFRGNHFGLVAGFVETGETLEECVAREVKEETSLEITNIRYVGSQPWPFPSNLMIAFEADYVSGEVRFADGELSCGGFFNRHNLPPLPTGASIARKLIEKWACKQNF